MLRLVNPPEVPGYTSDRDKAGGLGTMLPVGRHRSLPNLPPLDLLYAAGIAERAGIKVEIIDALGEKLSAEGVFKRLEEVFGPLSSAEDAIGVRLALPSLEEDLELAKTIRARFPRNRVFLFGNVLRSLREKARIPGVDLLFGEAEALILPYLRGEELPEEWAFVEDLDSLPFPAWHLLPLQNYAPKGRIASGVFALSTSRGCPRACPMCPYAQLQGRQWRFQSPERVLSELDWLFRLGIRTVQTRDPNIGINRARLLALAEGLIRRPYRMRLVMETDLETLDEELLKTL
ncbi:MAG: B12-binding domain-containing radical SAM protein, partial [Bacteroidota bacterium]